MDTSFTRNEVYKHAFWLYLDFKKRHRKEPLDIFRVLPSGFGNVTILLFPNPIEGSINVTKVLKWVFLENPTFDFSSNRRYCISSSMQCNTSLAISFVSKQLVAHSFHPRSERTSPRHYIFISFQVPHYCTQCMFYPLFEASQTLPLFIAINSQLIVIIKVF